MQVEGAGAAGATYAVNPFLSGTQTRLRETERSVGHLHHLQVSVYVNNVPPREFPSFNKSFPLMWSLNTCHTIYDHGGGGGEEQYASMVWRQFVTPSIGTLTN